MTPTHKTLSVCNEEGEIVALISIEDQRPAVERLPARRGALRPIRILEGKQNLVHCWHNWTTLVLRTENGQEARIKIVGFVPNKETHGFIQFV